MTKRAIHFVAFRGEEYWSAVRIWGRPGFVHRVWDLRARREIAEDDVVIFAHGTADDQPSVKNGADIVEKEGG